MKDPEPDARVARSMRQLADAVAVGDDQLDYSAKSLTRVDARLDASAQGAEDLPALGAYVGEVILSACPHGSWVARQPDGTDRPCLRFGKWYTDPTAIVEQIARDRSRGASVVTAFEQVVAFANSPTSATARSVGLTPKLTSGPTPLARVRQRLKSLRRS